MLRQKRTTVGLLTRANSAKVRTGNRANAAGIIQHQLGHPLFGRCKRGERGSNTLKHGKSKGNGG